MSPVYYWRHCLGDVNLADVPSRAFENYVGLNEKLSNWFKGRDFMYDAHWQCPEDISGRVLV